MAKVVVHLVRSALILMLGATAWNLALAHETSRSFLTLQQVKSGEPADAEWNIDWEIALADLDVLLELDRDLDGRLTRTEFAFGLPRMKALATSQIGFIQGGFPCRVGAVNHVLSRRADYRFIKLSFALVCQPAGAQLAIDYRLFNGIDAAHRVMVIYGEHRQLISPGQPAVILSSSAQVASKLTVLIGFVGEGIKHILIGWDHLAFLLAILIPILLTSRPEPGRMPTTETSMRSPISRRLTMTISAFTLAHSLTLGLAALGWVQLPAGPVEAAIAFSVVVAAMANLLGKNDLAAPRLAFVFGLLHGFGFASVMQQTGAAGHSLAIGLLGFNMGVEIGQFLFVLVLLPLFWLLSIRPLTRQLAGPAMSVALILLGAGWLIERITGLDWLPG